MRGTISDAAMRPVVIVLLDPARDRGSCFLHVTVLRGPDFLFLQAAMEPFDITVALRVIIGRAPMRDSQPVQSFDETRGSKLCSVVGGQGYAGIAATFWQTLK